MHRDSAHRPSPISDGIDRPSSRSSASLQHPHAFPFTFAFTSRASNRPSHSPIARRTPAPDDHRSSLSSPRKDGHPSLLAFITPRAGLGGRRGPSVACTLELRGHICTSLMPACVLEGSTAGARCHRVPHSALRLPNTLLREYSLSTVLPYSFHTCRARLADPARPLNAIARRRICPGCST